MTVIHAKKGGKAPVRGCPEGLYNPGRKPYEIHFAGQRFSFPPGLTLSDELPGELWEAIKRDNGFWW